MHEICQLLDNALVHGEVFILGQDEAEVEDELVPVITRRFHADGVAQDAVPIRAHLQEIPAELLSGDHEEGYIGEGEEGLLARRSRCGGDNRAIGDLVDDFGTCIRWFYLVAAAAV